MNIITVLFFLLAGIYILYDARRKIRLGKHDYNGKKIKIQNVCGYGLIVASLSLLLVELLK